MRFNITTTSYEDIPIMRVEGKIITDEQIDHLNLEIQKLVQSGHNNLIIDLSESPIIRSRGIGVLMRYLVSLMRQNGKLILLNPSRTISTELMRARLDSVFEIYHTQEEALSACHKST